jgi:hypothetical protein
LKIKRDPTRSDPLVNKYIKAYTSLFDGYKEQVVKMFRDHATSPVPQTVILATVEELAELLYMEKGSALVENMTAEAYLHGQRFADAQLRKAGLTDRASNLRGYMRLARLPGAARIRTNRDEHYVARMAGIAREHAIGINFNLQPDEQIFILLLQRNLAQLKGITEAMSQKIMAQISEGLLHGEGIDKLAQRITSTVDGVGIARATTMARTEALRAINQASLSRYYKAGVTKVQWLVGPDTPEGYPCEECLDLGTKDHGFGGPGVFPISDVPEQPHPNCRCTTMPWDWEL